MESPAPSEVKSAGLQRFTKSLLSPFVHFSRREMSGGTGKAEVSRTALRALMKDERQQEKMGYMYRQLKGEWYWMRLCFCVTSFGFACVAVLPSNPTLRLFLTGLFFLVDAFIVAAATPFEGVVAGNLLSFSMSLFGVIQIFVLLAMVQMGLSSGDGSLDLGHSATGQQNSANPSSDLTGASDEAQRFELDLGILCIVEALLLCIFHRKRLQVAAAQLRDKARESPVLQRMAGAAQRQIARVRGTGPACEGETRKTVELSGMKSVTPPSVDDEVSSHIAGRVLSDYFPNEDVGPVPHRWRGRHYRASRR